MAASVGFAAGMVFACGWWLPRILSRRHEHERALDPERASRRQRRERLLGRIGAVAGLVLGGSGLVLGLWLGGRIG